MNKRKQKTAAEYRVEEIGTVTVDSGNIVILDPCRIKRIAANPSIKPVWRAEDVTLARQIIDPPTPAKENPKKLEDFGSMGGNAVRLSTGFGDGEYSVTAEIVDFGESIGERIAAIHIRFIGTEDNEAAKKQIGNAGKKK
jgi:hypothetical protein